MSEKPKAIIIDLDGTLADIRIRLKHLQGAQKDWKSFNKTIVTDELHEWCREIMVRFKHDHKLIIVSGRTDDLKLETQKWLDRHQIPYDYLFMRKANDFRPDNIIKLEIFEREIRDKFHVFFVLDDRQKVVDMWRAEGLVVLQCAPGNF